MYTHTHTHTHTHTYMHVTHIHTLRVAVGCHICGSLEHKRRDCPQKAPGTGNYPRSIATNGEKERRKRKTNQRESNFGSQGTKRRKK